MKLIFVCTGNTCRSPMAEAYANFLIKERGLDAEADSAGLSAFEDDTVSENAFAVLASDGLAPKRATPRRFTLEIGREADVIFVMSEQHRDFIHVRMPELFAKTKLLGEGISDPFGGGKGVYEKCYGEIKKAVQTQLDRLFG